MYQPNLTDVAKTLLHVQRGPTCSRCDRPRRSRDQRLCRVCHAAYQREWRADRTIQFHALKARIDVLETQLVVAVRS